MTALLGGCLLFAAGFWCGWVRHRDALTRARHETALAETRAGEWQSVAETAALMLSGTQRGRLRAMAPTLYAIHHLKESDE